MRNRSGHLSEREDSSTKDEEYTRTRTADYSNQSTLLSTSHSGTLVDHCTVLVLYEYCT